MDSVLELIFILCLIPVLHTYAVYPMSMVFFFPKPRNNRRSFLREEDLPEVAVLIAAYNEEKVIREKVISVFSTGYPENKLKVYIGSDASADATDAIVEELQRTYPRLELVKFQGRTGKINIINHLQSLGDEDILIMTDANVIFGPDVIYELVKYFRDEEVGIVAANIMKQTSNNEGISYQEKVYLSLENRVKAAESNAFELVMGAEGGCYAIRNSLFSKVPSKFNVDDFYITFQVILKNKKVLFNPQAVCREDVPGAVEGEYRRKVRISSGNFQNLFFFRSLLVRFWTPLGYAFWSHKVLRWLTPFFLLLMFISSAILASGSFVFLILFLLQFAGFLLPAFDKVVEFKSPTLKFICHFYFMNLALLAGFVRFTRGIQSSIWQPVNRNVQ